MMLTPSCCSLHTNANICIRDLKKERRGGKKQLRGKGRQTLDDESQAERSDNGTKALFKVPRVPGLPKAHTSKRLNPPPVRKQASKSDQKRV